MALTPAQQRAAHAAQQQRAVQSRNAAVATAKAVAKPHIGKPLGPVKPAVPKVPKPVGPAPTPGARAMPPDAIYSGDMALAAQNRAQTEAALSQARQGTLIGAGYSETNVDPTTGVGTLAFNPNDPFSKAALLKKTYDASRARTAQQMGSGGGLYSGAMQQAQDIGNREQLGAENTLQNSLFSWLAQNTGATKQAGIDEQVAGIKADSARMGRLDTNPLYEPEARPKKVVTKKPTGGGGGGSKTTTKRKPQTLLAAPGAPKVTTKKKGRTVTYTRSVNRP